MKINEIAVGMQLVVRDTCLFYNALTEFEVCDITAKGNIRLKCNRNPENILWFGPKEYEVWTIEEILFKHIDKVPPIC